MTWMQGFFMVCMVCMANPLSAWAELYKCKTGRGTINYTNIPCMDKKPPAPVKLESNEGKSVQWVDPSHLEAKPAIEIKPLQASHKPPLDPVVAQTPMQKDSYTTAMVNHDGRAEGKSNVAHSDTLPNKTTTNANGQNNIVFLASQYHEGMRWSLRTSGTYVTYEQYEITHVENQIVSWQRTLLNAEKEPFAGGLTETFTMDLRQQPSPSNQQSQLTLAGYVFDTRKLQTEQAVSWHVDNLPLITPLIHYQSGDQTVLIEFTP